MGLSFFITDMVFRFSINFIASLIVVYLVYFRVYNKKNFAFAYMVLSATIFFLCYFLATVEFQLGLALGLFAIFGIIRYRTDSVPIKEMTYLFLVIALAIINALVSFENRLLEMGAANIVLVVLPYVIERFGDDKLENLSVVYDKIEFAAPDKRSELIKDLEDRLGFKVKGVKVDKVDLASNKVRLDIRIENRLD